MGQAVLVGALPELGAYWRSRLRVNRCEKTPTGAFAGALVIQWFGHGCSSTPTHSQMDVIIWFGHGCAVAIARTRKWTLSWFGLGCAVAIASTRTWTLSWCGHIMVWAWML